MRTIRKRELQGYFHTPVGYVFIGVFLTVASVLFYFAILRQRSGDLPNFIAQLCYLWMLLSPILTMRLLAEEKQKQTDQLLLTSPVSLPDIVLGKYLAAVTVLLLTTGLILLYAVVVAIYGTVYPAELAVNLLGFFLLGCAFVAMDLFLSGCVASPMTAAVLSFGANFLLWILDLLENAITTPWIRDILSFLSLYKRNEPFLMGQLSFAGILFDLSFIAVFLVLTVYHIDRRRWSGRLRGQRLRYGSVSSLMVVLILSALTLLNAGVTTLEKKKGWRVDLSFNAIASQSPETVEILKNLDTPVHMWALFRRGDEDAPLMELLDRYAAASELVTWEQVDPSLNPALLTRFTTDTETPTTDSLIIYCEKTGRFRILGPADYVSLGWNEETGEYSYTGWTYERSITGAISYVTRERIPQVVILQGHGELDGNALADFDKMLTDNQYEVVYADLTSQNDLLSPENLIIFFSPLRDLTDAELEALLTFARAGGSFLFTCDYSDPVSSMPNYLTLLRSYGFAPMDGIVLADPEREDTYYSGNRVWLLPEMQPTDLTLDLIASGATHLLLPGAKAFEEPEQADRNLTVSPVLRSGETSYRKVLTEDSVSIERGEEDPQGAFPLALQARRVTEEGQISRALIIGCAAALTDQQLYSMTDSLQFTVRTLEFLLQMDSSHVNILARQAVRPALSTASSVLGSVMIAALPVCVLLAAMLILIPRRRKVK